VTTWQIYKLTPTPWGLHYQFVESFDTEDDAKVVLEALEKVNISFKTYQITDWSDDERV